MRLSPEVAARAVGGELEGQAAVPIRGVSIDSRTLAPGSLFFAIRGPRHDGHTFLSEAFRAGAAGAVVERGATNTGSVPPPQIPQAGFLIRVDDPTRALGALARYQRLADGPRIVAITGSLGKTTTKEAAAAAIGSTLPVFRSPGNLNNQWGLPLSLLAREDEAVGVVELGMSAPGEIRALTEIAVPDCGLVTTIAEAHLAGFGSLDAIADAKGELFEALPPRATAVLNAEDERVRAQSERFRGRRVSYGFTDSADIRGSAYLRRPSGLVFEASAFGGPSVTVRCGLAGRHNAGNVLAGLAAAAVLEVPFAAAAAGVRALVPLPGRGRRVELPSGAVALDETYNSSPRALRAVLAEFALEPAARRLAVVGDMLELGDRAGPLHAECGRLAARGEFDLIVAVGPLARRLGEAAAGLGAPTRFAAGPEEAAALLSGELRSGDLVLFKASRAVGLDQAIGALGGAGGMAATATAEAGEGGS